MGLSAGSGSGVGTILQGAGAASSAVGSYYSAQSQRSSLNFQASLADINARLAESTAQSALFKGQKDVAASTMKAGQLKSSQRANMAANGVDLGVGSTAEVQASTDIMKNIDKNTIEANAVRSAWGYRMKGSNFKSDAIMKRATASGISPFEAASTSLLGSAGKVATSYYNYKKSTGGT